MVLVCVYCVKYCTLIRCHYQKGFRQTPKRQHNNRTVVLSKTAHGVMGEEENEQMGVGQDWVCLYVEKEYGGEEDEVLWPHRPKKQH